MASKEEKTISSLAGISLNDPRVKEIIESIKKNTSDELTGEVDPFIKFTEKALKYAPLITQFVKGLAENFKMSNAQQVQQSQPQGIQPPKGWTTMSLLQRESYKYKREDWYKQGMAYEQGGFMNTPKMTPPDNFQPSRNQPKPIDHGNNYGVETMESIKNKYPDPPLVEEQSNEEYLKENEKAREEEFMKVVNSDKKEKVVSTQTKEEKIENDTLINKLLEDNEKYINLGIDYINKLTDTKFIENVQDMEKWTKKAKKFLFFVPVQLKESLLMTSDTDFLKLLETRCKDKYDLMNDENIEDFKKMFNELKEKLSK